MPTVDTRLGLRADALADIANAATLAGNLRSDVADYLARLLDLPNDALTEGVVGDVGGVTRISANTVRVAAGSAWINGDGVTIPGLNGATGAASSGLYRVSWPQTDLTIASTGANKRADRIVVPVGWHGSSVTPVVVAGAQAVTVDHFNLQSAGALPAGRLQLATVIASTTGVSASTDESNGIRDRRRNAQGFDYGVTISQVADYTNATATPTVLSGALSTRVEGLAARSIFARLDCTVSLSATGVINAALFTDVATPGVMAAQPGTERRMSLTTSFAATWALGWRLTPPVDRSILVEPRFWVSSGGGTMTISTLSSVIGADWRVFEARPSWRNVLS